MRNVKTWLQSQLSCPLESIPTELYESMLVAVYTYEDIEQVKNYVRTVNKYMTEYVNGVPGL